MEYKEKFSKNDNRVFVDWVNDIFYCVTEKGEIECKAPGDFRQAEIIGNLFILAGSDGFKTYELKKEA
jgi:hypothetical protein